MKRGGLVGFADVVPPLLAAALVVWASSCASPPTGPTAEQLAAQKAAAAPQGPKSFAEAEKQFSDACPGPFFTLQNPEEVRAAEHR